MMGSKFRVFDENNNEMVYSDKCDAFYINTKGVLFMYRMPCGNYYKSYNVEIFTGLTDKDGVEIYEPIGPLKRKQELKAL